MDFHEEFYGYHWFKSNNNPVVPACLYLETLQELGKMPLNLRTDCGSETGLIAGIHCTLLQDIHAHTYGKSVANQRIENWWSHFRRGHTNWLINFFKDLVDEGIYCLGNRVHSESAWLVFSNLIENYLQAVKRSWNSHYIRKSHCTVTPRVPDQLFFLPEQESFRDCGVTVTDSDIQQIIQQRDVFLQKPHMFYVMRMKRVDRVFQICFIFCWYDSPT